jgi:hypothetical protein
VVGVAIRGRYGAMISERVCRGPAALGDWLPLLPG